MNTHILMTTSIITMNILKQKTSIHMIMNTKKLLMNIYSSSIFIIKAGQNRPIDF